MRNKLRQFLRTRTLPGRGIRRAHIIGCARSGTTMLHYAMATFDKVNLHEVESNIRYTPSITQSLALCRKPAGSWLITKREFGWFEPDAVDDLMTFLIAENIALINVVRDPRDVLVSRHAGNDASDYYVDPDRWLASITAGEKIYRAVSERVPALTLRYEDIVRQSDVVEQRLIEELELVRSHEAGKFNELTRTMTRKGITTNPWMQRALHSVRDFDQNSVGRWRYDENKRRYLHNLFSTRPDLHSAVVRFMAAHQYDYDPRELSLSAPNMAVAK